MDLNALAVGVKEIALAAGGVIMEIYQDESRFDITQKGDDSPLTAADREANAVICKGLEDLTPEIPIISEENKEIEYATRKTFRYAWLVDPVDGTKEFIKRNGEFTVNIALIHEGRTVLGVVYVPVSKELFWGIDQQGAFVSVEGKDAVQLHAPKFKMTDKGLGVVCSRSHLNEETTAFIEKLDAPQKVAKGSSLKFLVLAQGGAHVYPRLAPTMEWDTGAAQKVLEEAGGKVINATTQQSLLYNKENLRNPHFIAYANVEQ